MKYWKIRESMGNREEESDEVQEAYDCGYEDGYGAAMEEVSNRRSRTSRMNPDTEEGGYRHTREGRSRESMSRFR